MIPFEIDVADDLTGTEVRLNGEKVPELLDVQLHHRAGEQAELWLEVLPGTGNIVGEAEVRFIIGDRVFEEVKKVGRGHVHDGDSAGFNQTI